MLEKTSAANHPASAIIGPSIVPMGLQWRMRIRRTHTIHAATSGTRKMWLYSGSFQAISSKYDPSLNATSALCVSPLACSPPGVTVNPAAGGADDGPQELADIRVTREVE